MSRFLVVVVAAGWLAPLPFAVFVVALSLTDLVRGSLQAFDVNAVRLLTRGDAYADVVQTSLEAKAIVGLAGISILVGASLLIYDVQTAWLVGASGAGMLAGSFGSSFLVESQASLELHASSARVAVASVAGTAVAMLMIWSTRSAAGAVFGVAIADALQLAALYRSADWRPPDWRRALALVGHSRRLVIMQLAYIGQFRLGTVVLAAASTPIAVAEYALASRLAEGLVILAGALSASSLPLIGAAHARNEPVALAAVFSRSYAAGLKIIAPIVTLLVLTAPLWIDRLFPQYPGVGTIFAIVGLAVIIFFASSQTTALLNATHRDDAASVSSVSGFIASCSGILLLPISAAGVAWARVIGESVRLGSETAASMRGARIRVSSLVAPWLAILPMLAASAIAVAGNWASPYIWIAVVVAVAASGGLGVFSGRSS